MSICVSCLNQSNLTPFDGDTDGPGVGRGVATSDSVGDELGEEDVGLLVTGELVGKAIPKL